MILGVDDDTAALAVCEAAKRFPEMNNNEVYEYIREFEKVPVSRRQVEVAMRSVKGELKELRASLRKQKG